MHVSQEEEKNTGIRRFYAVLIQDLLCDEDLDQPRVAAGGGGVQRRPQLVVLRVDAGPPVQQDLHHLFVVVDATLRVGRRGALVDDHDLPVLSENNCRPCGNCCRRPSETRGEIKSRRTRLKLS